MFASLVLLAQESHAHVERRFSQFANGKIKEKLLLGLLEALDKHYHLMWWSNFF